MPGTGGGVSGGPIDLSSAIPEAPKTMKNYELVIGGTIFRLGEFPDDDAARAKAEPYVNLQREGHKEPRCQSDMRVEGLLREGRGGEK